MGNRAKDYMGVKVNGFVVIGRDENQNLKAQCAHWRIRCEKCGCERVVQSTVIRKSEVALCSCIKPNKHDHGIIVLLKRRDRLRKKLDETQEKLKEVEAIISEINRITSST